MILTQGSEHGGSFWGKWRSWPSPLWSKEQSKTLCSYRDRVLDGIVDPSCRTGMVSYVYGACSGGGIAAILNFTLENLLAWVWSFDWGFFIGHFIPKNFFEFMNFSLLDKDRLYFEIMGFKFYISWCCLCGGRSKIKNVDALIKQILIKFSSHKYTYHNLVMIPSKSSFWPH